MSEGGELGSGGFFGSSSSFGGLGGLTGPGPAGLGPGGHYGLWPSCGCSTLFIVLAVIFLICGGCLRMAGQ